MTPEDVKNVRATSTINTHIKRALVELMTVPNGVEEDSLYMYEERFDFFTGEVARVPTSYLKVDAVRQMRKDDFLKLMLQQLKVLQVQPQTDCIG
jgi:hypothetical protein